MDNQDQKKILLDIHFLKSNDFRTVFASGIYGGPTPNGLINVNFFTDRSPLPNRVTYEIDPTNPVLKQEKEKEGRKGFVREVHFGVVLDINTAKATIEWLQTQIETIEKSRIK
jgi:hypothetical protein